MIRWIFWCGIATIVMLAAGCNDCGNSGDCSLGEICINGNCDKSKNTGDWGLDPTGTGDANPNGLDTDPDTGSDADGDTDADTDTDTDTDLDTDSTTDTEEMDTSTDALASGLSVREVALYQSVKVQLMLNGEAAVAGAPLIRDKDALLRVFVERGPQWTDRTIRARADFSSETVPVSSLYDELHVQDDSTEENLSSTANIAIPKEYLAGDLKLKVTLVETDGGANHPGDVAAAEWPQNTMAEILQKDPGGPLEIVLVPVAYHADGSGRIFDTNAENIQRLIDAFYAQYPVAGVNVTVDPVFQWSGSIRAGGSGWDSLLTAITDYRNTTTATEDVYYYAIFNPGESLEDYCHSSCVAGLSWLVTDDVPTSYRASIGVGFMEGDLAAQTMVHEVAHAHGRRHSPCGSPAEVDPSYPHNGGRIGVWGYNLLSEKLMNPTSTWDMMSYCIPPWVSDYTYNALLHRIQSVNAAAMVAAPMDHQQRWPTLSLGHDGRVTPGPRLTIGEQPGGEAIALELLGQDMRGVATTTGYLIRFDHLPGGSVIFPPTAPEVSFIRLPGFAAVRL